MDGLHNISSGQSRFSLSCLNRYALMPQIVYTASLLKDGTHPAMHDGRSAQHPNLSLGPLLTCSLALARKRENLQDF